MRRSRFGSEIGHRFEPPERILEIRHRLAVGPPALGLLSRQDRIINGPFSLFATVKVECEKLSYFVDPAAVKSLQRSPDIGV